MSAVNANALQSIINAAGGRHKAFLALRLAGLSNATVADVVGNAGGAPTVAFALTAMRKKHGVVGNQGGAPTVAYALTQMRKKAGIVGTRENNYGLEDLAEATGVQPADVTGLFEAPATA